MKQYPSIPSNLSGVGGLHVHVFDKIDGSNIRAEWTRKAGFDKFGSRTRLLGPDEQPLGRAVGLIKKNYAEWLDMVFRQKRWIKTTAFFEFAGPSSAFGQHDLGEAQSVTLIDVQVHKQGIVEPKQFIKLFGGLGIPAVLHQGPIDEAFVASVRDGTLPGMGQEGVVCKGPYDRTKGGPVMFKIKRDGWYDRLRRYCAGDERLFEQMK